MKSYFPLLLICACALPALAETQPPQMHVTTGAGVNQIELTADTRITFSADREQMIVANGADAPAQSFNVDDIVNIAFVVDSNASLTDEVLDELQISHSGKVLTISGAQSIDYAVWNTSGVLITSGRSSESVSIDFGTLAPGIYVVKANDKAIKYLNH